VCGIGPCERFAAMPDSGMSVRAEGCAFSPLAAIGSLA
jgi:hypothetical protein